MAAAAKKKEAETFDLPRLNLKTVHVRLVGTSPLVVHAWSEKAKQEMRDKQQKRAKQAKEARNPEAEYEAAMYRTAEGRPAFPAIAFKTAAVDACSHVSGVTKVQARGAFHVIGDMVEINGEPHMREDMVRVGMGVADLRYRPEFPKWSCVLEVRYNANVLSDEQILNLFNTAGFAIGIGEHRPQRDGSWGMFEATLA